MLKPRKPRMGETPNSAAPSSRFTLQRMKTHCRKSSLTFGEFITRVYDAWGKRKAKGVVRLAVKAHLVEFRGQERFMIS